MMIINRSMHIIDYENNRTMLRDIPSTFDTYVTELIEHINGNLTVRNYKTRSKHTEVISLALQLLQEKNFEEDVSERTNTIAVRLLLKEVTTQGRIGQLNTNVQKGSLIQALLYDEADDTYSFLLAKVEHSDFVDDADFRFKTGFSRDKKSIWKSCLISLSCPDGAVFEAKIYCNKSAKYWSDEFLELDEMVSDETNTLNAFKSIDSSLNRNIKNVAPYDHTVIRNSIISYFKNHEHFDYEEMMDAVLGNAYQPTDLPQDKLDALREKLLRLPEDKSFDRQFNTVPSVINARIKTTYNVNDGIQIKITAEIPDLKETISAVRDEQGNKYIKIRTNNDATFRRFSSND